MSNNVDPQALLADRTWRLRHSLWLLAPILGFGALSFVGFIYVAIRVGNRKFWLVAGIASVASVAVWVLSPDPDASASAASDNVFGAVLLAVWAGSVVLGIVINRDYLRWRAVPREWWRQQRTGSVTSTLAPPAALLQRSPANGAASTPPSSADSQNEILGMTTGHFFGSSMTQQQPQPAPTSFSSPTSTPAPPVPPRVPVAPVRAVAQTGAQDWIHVNGASSDALVAAHLTRATSDRLIAGREVHGPYRDLEDLKARIYLEPHELVRLQQRAAFGGSQAGPSTEPPAPTGGRILDI